MQFESILLAGSFTFDGEWQSDIKTSAGTTTEGKFVCLESSTGIILGKLVPMTGGNPIGDILSGKREPPASAGGRHRVMLLRDDGTNLYLYTGLVTDQGSGNARANGRRLTILKPTEPQLVAAGDTTAATTDAGEAASGGASASAETAGAAIELALKALAFDDDEWVGTRPPT